MPLIQLDSACFTYPDATIPALDDISISIAKGEYLALVGNNGSGKSTLVRLFNGLKEAGSGKVRIKGLDPSQRASMFAVRSAIALVFQSPVDQIVSSVVEEDVAFGPSNLGLSREAVERRVASALDKVGLSELRKRPTRSLSGGQQQKLAIAGALAMEPECLVFDEATSMLDPVTKSDIIDLMEELAIRGMAVVHVTHDMDDAARAGRLIALDGGKIAFDGKPEEFFLPAGSGKAAPAVSMGFGLPKSVEAAVTFRLKARFGDSVEKLAELIVSSLSPEKSRGPLPVQGIPTAAVPIFSFKNASFSYLRGTAGEVKALEGISLEIPKGRLVAFVGRTGSGKSTALQLLNSLIQPSLGSVFSFGQDTKSAALDARSLRLRAPLSIQRPESALFELYAADDVAFGPKNMGLEGEDLVGRVKTWMDVSGIPYTSFRDRMTRSLSGGEKRKLALAGVFALESEAVLLDEPSAALDPASQSAVFELLTGLVLRGRTVVFATHSMEEAARADLVAVFHEGRLADFGSPWEIFHDRYDPKWGIARPYAVALVMELRAKGFNVEGRPLTLDALREALGSAPGNASVNLPRPDPGSGLGA